MTYRRRLCGILPIAVVLVAMPVRAQTLKPTDRARPIAQRLQLVADTTLIDRLEGGARLKLHRPQARNVVMTLDRRWEGNGSAYHTIFRDDGVYRMYYRALEIDREAPEKYVHQWYTCYAESDDGVDWTRPDLGMVEYRGSKANNIILEGKGTSASFTPFKDANPNRKPEARYKAVAGRHNGLFAMQSSDGINWEYVQREPIIRDGTFDSQNVAFWDSVRQEYRAYFRDFTGGARGEGRRGIKTATSEDFIHWSEPRWLRYPDAPKQQLYTNNVMPYPRAPHLLVGFPARFVEDRGDLVEPLFMTSRDGHTFHRWDEAIIPPGQNAHRWHNRSNYAWYALVQTHSRLPSNPPTLSMYANENFVAEGPTRLRRYTYRVDGFVSLRAPYSGGVAITKPLSTAGDELLLNLATSAAGSVRVTVLNVAGDPIPGLRSPELYGDEIDQRVVWKDRKALADAIEGPIRLRFTLKDADMFSFQFSSGPTD